MIRGNLWKELLMFFCGLTDLFRHQNLDWTSDKYRILFHDLSKQLCTKASKIIMVIHMWCELIESKAPFRLSIRTVDVTVKHYFPPSPPLRLLSFLLPSARPSAKSVKGSRGLIWLMAISHTHNSMVSLLLVLLIKRFFLIT